MEEQKKKQRVFICYASQDSAFVLKVIKHLMPTFDDGIFYYGGNQKSEESFLKTITDELLKCNIMIIFSGKQFSEWQAKETDFVIRHNIEAVNNISIRSFFHILLPGRDKIPDQLQFIGGHPIIKANDLSEEEAVKIARQIVLNLGLKWKSLDIFPINPHLFSYEKDIINFYINKLQNEKNQKNNLQFQSKIKEGCPEEWPEVVKWSDAAQDRIKNGLPLYEVGVYRSEEAKVVAAALTNYHVDCMIKNRLCFPEAGPRQILYYPRPLRNSALNIGILVSGGIAPGINAVIDGITQRHYKYSGSDSNHPVYMLKIFGYKNGFRAFEALNDSTIELTPAVTSQHATEGGSILGTSRDEELLHIDEREEKLRSIISQLYNNDIKILYIIGGDGSMKAAHAIWSYAIDYAEIEHKNYKLSVVAIPKTMDNDILWMWQSFGFLSAVEKARQVIEELAVEVKSNPRLCVVQLFGSDSGFVVSHAVFANRTGICDVALIPESVFSIEGLAAHLKEKMCNRSKLKEPIPYGLVVMAETAIPTDALNYIDDVEIGLSEDEKYAVRKFDERRNAGKRIEGQTDDSLRTAGLKIVSRGVYKLLYNNLIKKTYPAEPDWKKLRFFTNEPRHLLRAINPSSSDIIMAHRLGTLAVDNAMAGYTDFMISQWLTEYVLVPLKLVVLGRKRIPETGIFWKTVLTKTGQPAKL